MNTYSEKYFFMALNKFSVLFEKNPGTKYCDQISIWRQHILQLSTYSASIIDT